MNNMLFVIAGLVFWASVSTEGFATDGLVVEIGNEDVLVEVARKLRERSIWHEELPGKDLAIERNPRAIRQALDILNDVVRKFLPPERHFGFIPEDLPDVTAAFEEAGVKYHLIELQSNTYIVWEKSNTEEAMKIIDSVFVD